MADVLILFASREGQTEKIARRMAAVLAAKGHTVQLRNVDHTSRDLDLGRYQAILVGSPVRVGSYLPSIVRFVREQRAALERVPSAFFSVSLAVAPRKGDERNRDGRAETMKEDYQGLYLRQRAAVKDLAYRLGWTFAVHHTDESPLNLLLSLYMLMSDEDYRPSYGLGAA